MLHNISKTKVPMQEMMDALEGRYGVSIPPLADLLQFATGTQSFRLSSNSDDLPYPDTLNPLERKLLNDDLNVAASVVYAAVVARIAAQEQYEDTSLHNGNGDAFRHALWNSLMKARVGAAWAQRWADAHENGTTDQPVIEKEMDLFNNEVGRTLTAETAVVQAAVRGGKCRILLGRSLVPSNRAGERHNIP